MANQATDNRTNVSTGEAVTNWEDIAGTTATLDTEISYDTYTGSIGNYCTTTRDATIYNNGATGLFSSGDHAYLLINCGIVSLLDTKVNGGLTVRVTGATATDWAEFELFGSDEWPTAFDGGWIQIVVDIDELLANPTNTNGTPPTVGNIQRFGVTYITATVMPRMADNIWVGGFKILGSATPAIIVEGRNGGTTDWDWDSIANVAAVKLSAVIKPGPGGSYIGRGPIQFGINDTSTHAFTESNKAFLWDNQEVMLDGFYGLSALGNSGGTTNVTFGVKTGTGDTAVGAQGGSIQADSAFSRFFLDFDDPNVDGVKFYGMSLQHGGTFQLDDPAVEVISTLYIDCVQAVAGQNSLQLKNSIIQPANGDGVAFMQTDDFLDIRFCTFEFLDGHAIEITDGTVDPQENRGNQFLGAFDTATNGNDSAIYNNSASDLTINNTNSSNLNVNSYRNGTSSTTTIQNSVSVTITAQDVDGNPIQNAKVFLETTPGGVDIIAYGITNASGQVTTTYSGSTPQAVTGYVRKGTASPFYKAANINDTISGSGLSAVITMVSDE